MLSTGVMPEGFPQVRVNPTGFPIVLGLEDLQSRDHNHYHFIFMVIIIIISNSIGSGRYRNEFDSI